MDVIEFVRVLAQGAGWIVCAASLPDPLRIASGPAAVEKGRELAQGYAASGASAWLIVHNAQGKVVERAVYRPGDARPR